MDLDSSAFRDDEVELVRAGEVADAGVGDIGGLVGRHHVIPHTHLRLVSPLSSLTPPPPTPPRLEEEHGEQH